MSKRFAVLLGLLAYLICTSFLALQSKVVIFPPPDVEPIQSVEFSANQKREPDRIESSSWAPTELPDFWVDNHSESEQIWYRAEFSGLDLDSDTTWAAYLPAVAHNAAVYINGTWIGQGGSFSDPISRHHNDPLLFRFSPNLLQAGTNQIAVRVKAASHRQGRLGQIYVAPLAQLESAYRFKKLIRVDIVLWITVSMFAMSIMIFAFWIARPQDYIYSLFSLELFIWAAHNLNLLVTDIPVSARVWEALNISTLGWVVVVLIIFVFRFLDSPNVRMERFLTFFGVSAIGLFFLPDVNSVLAIGYRVLDTFLLVFGSYSIYFLAKEYWQKQQTDVVLMLLVGIPILSFGLHDILIVNGISNPEEGLIIQYSVVPAIFLFSWFLIRRFVQSIDRAESLAAGLEIRVAQRTQELEVQHLAIQALQKKSVLAAERERIMRDMHDGMGGQLLSIRTFLRDHSGGVFDKVKEKIERSLTDLRSVIDSLDPLYNDLPVLLGMMRGRLQDQLDDANVQLEWGVSDVPEFSETVPTRSLHIMRIVQEATTNAIRHSGCTRIRIGTGVLEPSNGYVYVDVIDNGSGITSSANEQDYSSRGTTNMRNRAMQIKAELELSSTDSGTHVRLLLPLL